MTDAKRIDSGIRGAASELKAATALLDRGIHVFVPVVGTNPKYDLLVDTGKRLLKIQVKTARLKTRSRRDKYARYVVTRQRHGQQTYVQNDFDFLIAVVPTGQFYIIPQKCIIGKKHYLRLCNTAGTPVKSVKKYLNNWYQLTGTRRLN